MSFIDNALGTSPHVMAIRGRRTELLAANIANADTPGYKARDIDFKAALADAVAQQKGLQMTTTGKTHRAHIEIGGMQNLMYRVPLQPSIDGNTVEAHIEQAAFTDNAIRYQASVNFFDNKVRSIISTLKDGQ